MDQTDQEYLLVYLTEQLPAPGTEEDGAVCALFQRKDAEVRGSVFSSAVTRCSGGDKIGPEFHSAPRAHDARAWAGRQLPDRVEVEPR